MILKLTTIMFNLGFKKSALFFFLSVIICQTTLAQNNDGTNFKVVVAGPQYNKGGLHQFLFGKHYRKEWTTEVRVPIFKIDSAYGGLTPLEEGGGRQSKTLRLKDKNGRQYVLRTVNKNYNSVLPEEMKGTFIENLANDQVSSIHPFSAIVVPPMAEAAGILHTNPKIVFVPESETLGRFNKDFGNTLCLFEERPDDNWEHAPFFANSKNIVGTEKMLENVLEHNDHKVDQKLFLRSRLFDMFVGDWGRHDDNWRWAKTDSANFTIYKAIPRDRDQMWTLFGGLVPSLGTSPEELEHLQSFADDIKNVKKYNFPARNLDRRFTNELTQQDWTDIAKDLQSKLSDYVIENSIKLLPPEIFPISGNDIIEKLKSRRNELLSYALKHYKFVNEMVEVVGTKEAETFNINRLNDKETEIKITTKNSNKPFYSRVFNTDEVDEIIVYGIEGNDVFNVDGTANDGFKIRIVGSRDNDTFTDNSSVGGPSHKTRFYDSKEHQINGSKETKTFISSDTAINSYVYAGYKYNTGHTIKSPSFNNADDIHVRFGYTYQKQHWRVEPFGWEQTFKINYSISQNSFSADYDAIFNEVIRNWSLVINGRFDAENQLNYFGLGNETITINDDHRYHRIQTNELGGRIGLSNRFLKNNTITLSGFYHTVKVLDDKKLFVSEILGALDPTLFNRKNFAGALLQYNFSKTNNALIPTKGFTFLADASYTQNIKDKDRAFTRLSGLVTSYIPFSQKFSMQWKTGASTVNGETEFYQMPWLGGGQNLKGFRRQRFYGETIVFNSNELRWITNINTRLIKGKIGLVGFLDEGRVWMPNEDSNTWHIGYGGGLMIAPFNKLVATVYFGMSKDDALIHLRVGGLAF